MGISSIPVKRSYLAPVFALVFLLVQVATSNGQSDRPVPQMVATEQASWHYSENWIQPYHHTFGNQAPKGWLSGRSLNMQLFRSHQSGSLILIIKDEYKTLEEAVESLEYDLSDLGLVNFSQLNTSWSEYSNTRQSDFVGKTGQHRTMIRLLLSEYEGNVYTMLYLTKEPFLPEQAETTLLQVAHIPSQGLGEGFASK